MRMFMWIYAVIVIGLIASCKAGASEEIVYSVSSKVDSSVVSVKTADSKEEPFIYYISSNGKIGSAYDLTYTAETGGTLISFSARSGKFLQQGAIIGQFETEAIERKLKRAKLMEFSGEKEYQSQLLGYENLLKEKTVEEAAAIKQKLRISSGFSMAEQDVLEATEELKRSVIRASFSGIVADVRVREREYIKVGQEMFRMYDPYDLKMEIKIMETDILLLKQGIHAEISTISAPDMKYDAVIHEINRYVDDNGMVSVMLRITSARNAIVDIFPGMNCTALIKVPLQKTIIVPKEALVIRGNRAVVFTLNNGKAVWNDVERGRDNGREVEIRKGIRGGQKVIITNNVQLTHDTPVKEEN